MIQLKQSDWTDKANMQWAIPHSTLHVPSKFINTSNSFNLTGVRPFRIFNTYFDSYSHDTVLPTMKTNTNPDTPNENKILTDQVTLV